ncbi:MAG: DNA-3-methyladenine glycosylase [Erysipelotrichales bacterium]|nr:DNA-3-methyladenine glycosylase [Erysipelotrichales bacterium]
MNKRLGQSFYQQNALTLAPLILGKLLVRKINGEEQRYRITEIEIYYGEADTACHASKGKTERTKVMYETGGVAYIYLCYGIHYLFNVVTGPKDHPEALLIRGVENYSGPGRLTKALNINKALNGEDFVISDKIWLEDDGFIAEYELSKRIGIDYANIEDRDKLWRLVLK